MDFFLGVQLHFTINLKYLESQDPQWITDINQRLSDEG